MRFSRICSLLVSVVFLAVYFASGKAFEPPNRHVATDINQIVGPIFLVTLPLLLIWFPEFLSISNSRRFDAPTPPWMMALVGWFFLFFVIWGFFQ